MRSEWRENPNPTLQISLYKLLASEEELRRLSVTKQEIGGNEGKELGLKIEILGGESPITIEPKDESDTDI
jgi:hypothetical protein